MWPNPQDTLDLVTFIEEPSTGKLYFWVVQGSQYKVMC